jgi:hypothetical protein
VIQKSMTSLVDSMDPTDSHVLNPIRSSWLAMICDRCQHEISCHILTTDSWHQFLLCPDTSLGPQWDRCLNFIGSYMVVYHLLAMCHLYVYLSNNEVLSISVCYLSLETSLYIVIYAETYLLIGCECAASWLLLAKQSLLMCMAEVVACFLGHYSLISQCHLSVAVFQRVGRLILFIH